MKRTARISGILVMILLCSGIARAEEMFSFGPFGTVHVYEGRRGSSGVVLFISGDGGWNKGVVDMARALSNLGPIVVGVDIRRYLEGLGSSNGACSLSRG